MLWSYIPELIIYWLDTSLLLWRPLNMCGTKRNMIGCFMYQSYWGVLGHLKRPWFWLRKSRFKLTYTGFSNSWFCQTWTFFTLIHPKSLGLSILSQQWFKQPSTVTLFIKNTGRGTFLHIFALEKCWTKSHSVFARKLNQFKIFFPHNTLHHQPPGNLREEIIYSFLLPRQQKPWSVGNI